MKCIKCNYDNLDGMKYCVNCGFELMTKEENAKRHNEGEAGVKSLMKVIIGLIVVLAIVVGLVFLIPMLLNKNNEEAADNDTPGISEDVDQITAGVWKCSNDEDDDVPTTEFVLVSDGTFKIGPANGLDDNRFEGTYETKFFDAVDDTGNYNLYQVIFTQEKVVENGEELEEEAVTTYSLGIGIEDTNMGMFVNSVTNNTFYCKR